jgi:PAS domain S-box-containing protein
MSAQTQIPSLADSTTVEAVFWDLMCNEHPNIALLRRGEIIRMTAGFSQELYKQCQYQPIIGEILGKSATHHQISKWFEAYSDCFTMNERKGKFSFPLNERFRIEANLHIESELCVVKIVLANLVLELDETRRHLQFYEAILDNIPADIAVFDPEHRYIYINKQAIKNPDTRAWIIGKNDFEFCQRRGLPLSIAEQRRQSFINTVNGISDPFLEEFSTVNEHGQVQWKYRKFYPHRNNNKLEFVIGYGIDVTEMKNQRLRFLEIAHRLDEIVFQIDSDSSILFLSNAFERITGYKAERFVGKGLISIATPDDQPKLLALVHRFLNQTTLEETLDFRIQKSDGSYSWARIKFFCENSTTLDPLLAGIIQDIDASIKANSTIEQQKLAIENSIEGVGIMNGLDQYTYLNKAHIEIFGYNSVDELLGKSWKVLYPPDEILRIENEIFPEFIKNGFYRGTTKGLKKDGSFIFQEISLTVLPDNGLICITHDVTEEKKKSEEFARLAIVAEKTNSIVIITNERGEIQWVNESFNRITGYSSDFVIGKYPNLLCGSGTDSITIEEIQHSILNGTSYRGEILNYTVKGDAIWLYLDITPIHDQQGKVVNFIVVESDVTALKLAEENTVKALNKERQLNQFKSHFINLVSHEFRTPLATIKSSMDILGLQFSALSDPPSSVFSSSFGKHHTRIVSEIDLMSEIMENILLMGRLDSGRMVFMPEPVFLCEVIASLIEELRFNPNFKRKIHLTVEGEPNLHELDRTQVRHIFTNLVSNALKYSDGADDPQVTVNYQTDGVILSVRDFGIGIPPNEIPHLFTSFYRASNTVNIQGTGLGLVIVKQLVEMNSGRISHRKTDGPGALFVIEFPNLFPLYETPEENSHH